MIRGVIFDCFGVLAHGYLDYLRSLASPDRVQEISDLNHACDRGMISRHEYMERASEVIGKPVEELEVLAREQILRSDEMTSLVRSLRPTYKIAMLSNVGKGVMDDLFSPEEREQLFDAVVLSSEAGVTKPSREAFELTAQRLGLLPEECVMIDDLPKNIEAAQQVGMQALLCESPAQCVADLASLLKESNA